MAATTPISRPPPARATREPRACGGSATAARGTLVAPCRVMLNVGTICSRDVDLADAEESVREAARRMTARSVGTLVVLDAGRRPYGILTDRDLATRVLGEDRDPAATRVRDVLSTPVHTLGESATLDEAVRRMRHERCRRLAVVSAGGELVGIVSLDDVLTILADELRWVATLLESEAPHRLEESRARP